MIIDIVILVGALLFAILGYLSGAIRQILKIVVIVASYFIAKNYYTIIEPFISDNFEIPPKISMVIAMFIIWIIVSIILSIISNFIMNRIFYSGKEILIGVDRFAGALISLAKYMIVVYLIFSTILNFKYIIGEHKQAVINKLDQSYIVGFIDNNNLLKNTTFVGYPARLSEISVLPEVMFNIGLDCHTLSKINLAPGFCLKLISLAESQKEVNILDKRFREIVQDEKFREYIMSEKVELWIERAKAKKAEKNEQKLDQEKSSE